MSEFAKNKSKKRQKIWIAVVTYASENSVSAEAFDEEWLAYDYLSAIDVVTSRKGKKNDALGVVIETSVHTAEEFKRGKNRWV